MVVTRGSRLTGDSSERVKCRKIFNALYEMLQKQQTEIDYLVDERTFLKVQNKALCDGIDRLIDQENRNLKIREKSSAVQSAKADMLLGLKNREAVYYKLKSDNLSSELVDFRTCFDHLSLKQSTSTGAGRARDVEYDKLLSEKEVEILSLRAEQGFVWNQYKLMEGEHKAQLKQKEREVELSRERTEALLLSVERFRSEAAEKDGTITALRADLVTIQAAKEGKATPPTALASAVTATRPPGGMSRCGFTRCVGNERSARAAEKDGMALRADVATIQAVKVGKATPPTALASAVTATRPPGGMSRCGITRCVGNERSARAPNRPRVSTQKKRKHIEDDEISVTPLFTSSFKIPKLKK